MRYAVAGTDNPSRALAPTRYRLGRRPRFRTIPATQALATGAVATALGMIVIGAGAVPQSLALLLVVASVAPFVALIVGNVRRLLLAIIVLDIPLQLDMYLSYRLDLDMVGAVPGFNVSITTLCLAVLYGLWLAEALAAKRTGAAPVPRLDIAGLAYVGVVGLSVLYAQSALLAAFDAALLLQFFLLSVFLASWIRTPGELLFVVRLLFVALLVEVSLMMAAGQGITIPGLSTSVDTTLAIADRYRLAGTFGSPNYAASFLAMILVPALSMLLSRASSRDKWLAGATVGAGSVALILTFSRGGWVAASLAISILGLVAWRRGWLSPGILLAAIAALTVVGLSFGPAIQARLGASDEGAALSRLPLVHLAWRMIEDHWLVGVGANNFVLVMPQYLTPDVAIEWVYLVHNKYLLVGAETGIIGLFAFLLFLLISLRRGISAARTRDRLLAPLAAGLTASIIGLMSHMLFEYFNRRSLELLWIYSALLVAINCIAANPRSDTPTFDSGREGRP